MSPITTHVLDTAAGRPAKGVPVTLELQENGAFREIGRGATDDDGRCKTLLADGHRIAPGHYRITFDTSAYFKATATPGFFPIVPIHFEIQEPAAHYHVPLLLSPFGFSTYRGS